MALIAPLPQARRDVQDPVLDQDSIVIPLLYSGLRSLWWGKLRLTRNFNACQNNARPRGANLVSCPQGRETATKKGRAGTTLLCRPTNAALAQPRSARCRVGGRAPPRHYMAGRARHDGQSAKMLAIFRGFGHKSSAWWAIPGLRLRNEANEADDRDDRKSGTSSGKRKWSRRANQ